jgi:DNA-directed RNA polymerase subunit L
MKIFEKNINRDSVYIKLTFPDTAIFEYLIERLNQEKDTFAYYRENHPLTHEIEFVAKGKNIDKKIKEIIKKLEKEFL